MTQAHPNAEIPGFKYLGLTSDGLWGQYTEDDGSWSEQQRQQWRLSLTQRKQERLREEKTWRNGVLTVEERDSAIRKLLSQLSLKEEHSQDLQQRGLTPKQITAGGFRSVEPWQRLETEVSHQLAGVSLDGRSLITPFSGYICPIRDVDGHFIGWQIRLNDPEGGKYRWATSRTKKRPNGPTAHLPNGELPLSCCRPLEDKPLIREIGLIEGVGPKPFITAIMRSQIVLGAAGGNFAASPQTLKAYLNTLSTELGTKQLILYPDAGAISNPSVRQQYWRLKELVTRWGYTLRVAWWNQIYKNADLDADELLVARRGEEISEITWAQFEAIVRNPNRIYQEILKLFQKAGAFIKPSFVGFGSSPQRKALPPLTQPSSVDYVPGQLPTPHKYQAMGAPKVIFKPGDRLRLYQEARFKGFQFQLDNSAPGCGKSHDVGLMVPAAFFLQNEEVDDTSQPQEKLIYFSQSSRNPTVETIERNFTLLPIRHNGLTTNPERKSPMGNPFVHWPKPGQEADITANCHLSHLHLAVAGRNLGINSSSARGKSDINPICRNCQFLADRGGTGCQNSVGDGYGFKAQMKAALPNDRLRATLLGFPDLKMDNIGVIVDEAMANLSPTLNVTATLHDLSQTFIILKNGNRELYERLLPIKDALEPRINGAIPSPQFGWDYSKVRSFLGDVPPDIDQLIEQLQPLILNEARTDLGLIRGYESPQWIEEHCLKNWLVPFLQVWANIIPGSLRITSGKVVITLRNDRELGILKSAAFAIFQDATASRERLAQYLEIEPAQIMLCEQRQQEYDNLSVVHVTGLGQAKKNRSLLCDERIKALKIQLSQTHSNIGFIDWKTKAAVGELSHFSGSRGSNEYATKDVIASFGVPYQNLSALQDVYQCITGKIVPIDATKDAEPDFQRFIDEHTQAEIFQEIGRLRVTRRQEERLTFYFCGDYSLDFLEQYGIKVTTLTAAEVTPAAGDATTRNRWFAAKLFETAYAVGRNLAKITQAEIAKELGITQGRLSQLFASVEGGWRGFKKLLISLLEEHKGKLIISEGDIVALLENTTLSSPQATLEAVEGWVEVIRLPNVGWKGLGEILATYSTDIQIETVGLFLGLLFDKEKQEGVKEQSCNKVPCDG